MTQIILSILVDLKHTFETIDMYILIKKLFYIGREDCALKLITIFFGTFGIPLFVIMNLGHWRASLQVFKGQV